MKKKIREEKMEVVEGIKKYQRIVDELNELGLWKDKFDDLLKTEKEHFWNLRPAIYKKNDRWVLTMNITAIVPSIRQDEAEKIGNICEKHDFAYLISRYQNIGVRDKTLDIVRQLKIEVRSKTWEEYIFEDPVGEEK